VDRFDRICFLEGKLKHAARQIEFTLTRRKDEALQNGSARCSGHPTFGTRGYERARETDSQRSACTELGVRRARNSFIFSTQVTDPDLISSFFPFLLGIPMLFVLHRRTADTAIGGHPLFFSLQQRFVPRFRQSAGKAGGSWRGGWTEGRDCT